MANSNGWGDGAANNAIGWGQGANNAIAWGDSHAKSWAGSTDIVGIDADAQAFITAAAITDPVQINAINTLVEGMKTDGLWTKMKAIYPFVGGTASAHKWNLKDPRDLDAAFRLVFNGGWTHSANGATPNGTNGYADTKLVPSSVLSYSNNHMSYYSRTSLGQAGDVRDMGASSANISDNNLILIVRYPSNSSQYYVVDEAYNYSYSVGASSAYYAIGTSTDNTVRQFKNTTKLGTYTKIGSLLPSVSAFIGAANTNGTATRFNNLQSSFASIGDGLTDTEAANLYTRVQAFQTALSRQV